MLTKARNVKIFIRGQLLLRAIRGEDLDERSCLFAFYWQYIERQTVMLVLKVTDAADALWDLPVTIIGEGRLVLGKIEGWLFKS